MSKSKATFNVFGGLQAAIELTGALNWAPPKELVALRTAPTMGIGSDKDAKKSESMVDACQAEWVCGGCAGRRIPGNGADFCG